MTDTENTKTVDLNAPIDYEGDTEAPKQVYKLPKPDTWFFGEIAKVTKRVCDSGTYELTCLVKLLDENGEKTSFSVPLKLYMLIRKPDGTLPNTVKGCHFFFRAIDPSFTRYHRKNGKGYTSVTPEGENDSPVNYKEYTAQRDVVFNACKRKCVDLWNDPDQLLEEQFYLTIQHEKDQHFKDNERIWTKVFKKQADEPQDEAVEYEDFLYVPADDTDEDLN